MQQPPNQYPPSEQYTQYQPSYQSPSYYQQPPQPPPPAPKQSLTGTWIITIIIIVLLIGALAFIIKGIDGFQLSSTTTGGMQSANLQWTTTHTFTGNGVKKTAFFTVADDWQLIWKCDPSSFIGGSYNVQVFVYGSDGSLNDVAINTLCKNGNVSGSTEEHQGGNIYLEVNSEAAWTIQVQEPK